jgi:hypothetical protein
MATETATGIVLIAGTMTFVNEWYQTKEVNWKVPIATALGAAVFDGIAKVNGKGATALALMVLIAASVTRFNGKSPSDLVTDAFQEKRHARKRRGVIPA